MTLGLMQRKVMKFIGVVVTLTLLVGTISWVSRAAKTVGVRDIVLGLTGADAGIDKTILIDQLGPAIVKNEFPGEFPFVVAGDTKSLKVSYTIQEAAQNRMRRLLNQYRPDYAAFVALDAKTGRIISLLSHSRVQSDIDNLALRATFPAASIFKVVTAGAALDLNKAAPQTIVPFNGSLHTLYKRNLENTRENRWTRRMTLRKAFGLSVNMFFGKLGLFYVGPQNLHMYAERFMFNQPIPADIPVQVGYSRFSLEDPWSVASAASGFTHDNTMSPLHGALIAAAVANDGVMMAPYLVESLVSEAGTPFYQAEQKQASIVVEPRAAEDLRELFYETVRSGTSRKSFRQIKRRAMYEEVEFGGKTGSLTGKDPVGKCDWFVGYARYRDQRIAVAALTVNEKKWRVKSSMLAKLFFQDYIKDLKRLDQIADVRSPASEKSHKLAH